MSSMRKRASAAQRKHIEIQAVVAKLPADLRALVERELGEGRPCGQLRFVKSEAAAADAPRPACPCKGRLFDLGKSWQRVEEDADTGPIFTMFHCSWCGEEFLKMFGQWRESVNDTGQIDIVQA